MGPPEPLQKLDNLDKTSPEFYQEISEFIRGKDYRDAVPNLKGEGLVWLVEYLDGVIVGISDPAGPAFQSLRELRRICGVKEVLPSSCTLSDPLSDVTLLPTSEYVHVGTLNGSGVRIRRTGAYSKRGSRKVMKAFYQIAVVWRHLSHPNILPLLGVTTNPLQLVSDSMSGVILPEYIAGSPGADRRSLLSDTAAGLSYLHFYGLVHGDLAGSNIVVDVAGRAMVTDFGVTTITQNLDLTQSTPAEVGHGARWIAPEILDGRSTYTKEGDVFSFAMVAIEAFTGAFPFNDKPPRAAMLAIMGGKRPPRPTDLSLTDELWALTQQCWDQETRQRPTALQILRGLIPAWKRLIDPSLDPKERVSLIEATFSDRDEVEAVRRLCGEDAQSFIDIADEVLDSLERRLRRKCLKLLCKICGSQALLPRSIQVSIRCDRSGTPLYRGGYADVWEGECKGLKVAVKVLRVYSKSDFDQVIHKFCMEVMTWKTLCHPNVLPLLGVSMHNYNFSMASEWMENRNIIEFVKAHRDANRFKLLKDVTQGLMYMHGEEMVHGDLKGANILINKNGDAVLADFGLLTIVSDSTYSSTSGSFASAGTTRWMSPELLDPEPFGCKSDQPTEKSDCYALGMTVLEVLSGKLPFHYYKDLTVMQKILDCEQPERPTGPEGVWFTDDLWEMLRLCWSPKPNNRPTIEVVLGKLEHGLITWEPLPPSLDEDLHTDPGDDSYSTVTSIMGHTAKQHGARFPHDEASQSLTDCWSDDFQGDAGSDGDESVDSTATIHASAPRKVEPLPIPQRQYGQLHYENYRAQFGLETPIMFPSCSGQKGILLDDAMNEVVHDLVGGDEPVFASYTRPAISLRILWPGYAFWIKTIEIRDWRSGQKRINKAQLAIEIAKKVHQFTQEMINVSIDPGSEEWRVGPGFVEANNIVLISLVNVTEGSWQPELRLLPKPPGEEA